MRTVGVEEEFLLLGARTDDGRPAVAEVLRLASTEDSDVPEDDEEQHGSLVRELKQQQVEANTAPHASMEALETELLDWRRRAADAAERLGISLVASGTSPGVMAPRPVHTERYDRMARRFGAIARDQLCCGCHVHVQVASLDEAVGVLDRIRVWLPVLLALSANSPFFQGEDTGYASFRSQMWGRWPSAGAIDVLGSAEAYRTLVDSLLDTGVVLDEGMIYFDARFSSQFSTLEIRVADVCVRVADSVLIAALCRALVETSAQEWAQGSAAPSVPTRLVEMAKWQASRWGTSGDLLDPITCRPRPAEDVVAALLDDVRPALVASGDLDLVEQRVQRILTDGPGAELQRGLLSSTGDLDEVVRRLARQTTSSGDVSGA